MQTALNHPLAIRRVLPKRDSHEPHQEYGFPFSTRGDYLIPLSLFEENVELLARKHGIDRVFVEAFFYNVLRNFANLFYSCGELNWEEFLTLWDLLCANCHRVHQVEPGFDYERALEFPLVSTGWWHERALHDAVMISKGSFPELLKWYQFGIDCVTKKKIEGPVFERLAARYLRGRRDEFYLTMASHVHHEGDFFITLMEKSSFLPDFPSQIATCGYRLGFPCAIIENLQSSRIYKEAKKIGWRWFMVKATEEHLKELGVGLILFRPGSGHWYRRQAGESRLYRIMDMTALDLGYLPVSDSEGKVLVYSKQINPEVTFDFDRPEMIQLLALKKDESDGWIPH